jgi:hypothetical protein
MPNFIVIFPFSQPLKKVNALSLLKKAGENFLNALVGRVPTASDVLTAAYVAREPYKVHSRNVVYQHKHQYQHQPTRRVN